MQEEKKWYAIRTQSNMEKSVLHKLNLEITRSGLENIMGRWLIPTEKVFAVKNGKKYAREKVLYPGYLFLETSHIGEISSFLKEIRGAAGFVKTKAGDITPLQDWEVKKMLSTQDENDNVTTSGSIFSLGESVKVVDGPFSTFKGKITNVDSDKKKIKVEVLIFSRPTLVELDFMQVERD